MSWICLIVLLSTVFSTLLFKQDIFSPARIYIVVYSLLLTINGLYLSSIQVPWCNSTNLFFWGASSMFIFGAVMIQFVTKSKYPLWKLDFGQIKNSLARDAKEIDWKFFTYILFFCSLFFFLSFLIAFIKIGQIPVFSSDPDNVRLAFADATFITYYGLYFGPISLMLCIELILFGPFRNGKQKALYFLFFSILMLFLTIVTRFDIFRFLIFFVILYHYGIKNLKFSHIVFLFLGILIVFFSASLIRLNSDAAGSLAETIKVKLPKNLAWASGFYAYLANDFWNMNYAFAKYAEGSHSYPHSLGLGMMRALTFFTLRIEGGLIQTFGYDTVMNPMATRVEGLNTVVYVWHIWKDFGTFGTFLVPLIGGLLLSKFYLNSMLKPTLFRMSMWGCLIAMIILSFHFPIWELWFFHVNLVVIALAHKKILFNKS